MLNTGNFYSQFGEDKYISDVIVQQSIDIPKIIFEAGGYDGITFSNSRHFIEHGWEALLAEPKIEYFKKIIAGDKKNLFLY
jgi:hypothetical protein